MDLILFRTHEVFRSKIKFLLKSSAGRLTELEVKSVPIHSVVFGPSASLTQRSNENSLKPFQRKVQRQRALVLKSMTWLHNTREALNTDSHFPFWLGSDSPMTTPTSAAAPASSRYIIHAAARFAKGHTACFDFWTRRNNLQNICVSLLVLPAKARTRNCM